MTMTVPRKHMYYDCYCGSAFIMTQLILEGTVLLKYCVKLQ